MTNASDQLIKVKDRLNILYHNVQSLNDKKEELRIIARNMKPKIIALVETWLDKSHSNGEIALQEYNITRKDRSEGPNRGGVCIYTDKSFKVTDILMPPHPVPCRCENLWVEITCKIGARIVVGSDI